MFEKYTERAKKILFLARYEASQMGSKVIASEHLLLGLLKEGDEVTREIFRRSNVNVELLQAELEARGPSGEKISTICNNSVEFVKALFGIHRAGLVWVPINTMLGTRICSTPSGKGSVPGHRNIPATPASR